jgi:hypothetical protein
MLCITNYTQKYIDDCRKKKDLQPAAYYILTIEAKQHQEDESLSAAVESFETIVSITLC